MNDVNMKKVKLSNDDIHCIIKDSQLIYYFSEGKLNFVGNRLLENELVLVRTIINGKPTYNICSSTNLLSDGTTLILNTDRAIHISYDSWDILNENPRCYILGSLSMDYRNCCDVYIVGDSAKLLLELRGGLN